MFHLLYPDIFRKDNAQKIHVAKNNDQGFTPKSVGSIQGMGAPGFQLIVVYNHAKVMMTVLLGSLVFYDIIERSVDVIIFKRKTAFHDLIR